MLIHGLAGMGKSTLASRFLQHHRQLPSERVTRYDFYERAYFADFLRGVGGYYELAPEGEDAAAFRTALLRALLDEPEERVIVLENFEIALDAEDRIADEHIRYVLEGLIQGQSKVRLLITSLQMPNLGRYKMRLHQPLPTGLAGLPRADADKLLVGLDLSEEEKAAVYDLLGGHPTAVGLLAALLQDPFEILPLGKLIPQLQTLRGRVGGTPFLEEVTAELLDRLYQQLSPAEQALLHHMAILRRPFAPDFLGEVAGLGLTALRPLFAQLGRKALLGAQEAGLWDLPPLVRASLLNQMTAEAKQASHLWAAVAYHERDQAHFTGNWQTPTDLHDVLEAAYHYLLAEREETALELWQAVSYSLQTSNWQQYRAGDYATVAAVLQQAITAHEELPDELQHKTQLGKWYFHWAMSLRRMGDSVEEVRPLLVKATHLAPNNPKPWQAWGLLEKQEGNFERARELFEQGIAADPHHAPLWQAWGLLEKEVGNITRARELFEQGTAADPHHAPLWQAWGLLEKEVGNITRARELFEQGTAANSHHTPSLYAWGLLEKEAGNLVRARELFERGTTADPYYAPLWQTWGLMEKEAGNITRARELFEQGTTANPYYAPLWQTWGLLEKQAGNLVKARELFERGIVADSKHAPIWQVWGTMEKEIKNNEKAREYLIKAIQYESKPFYRIKAYIALGQIAFEERDYALAEREYRAALREQYHHLPALTGLADALTRQQKREEAEKIYQQALTTKGELWEHARAHGQYAILLTYDQRTTEAIAQFEASLALHENNYYRQQLDKLRP